MDIIHIKFDITVKDCNIIKSMFSSNRNSLSEHQFLEVRGMCLSRDTNLIRKINYFQESIITLIRLCKTK